MIENADSKPGEPPGEPCSKPLRDLQKLHMLAAAYGADPDALWALLTLKEAAARLSFTQARLTKLARIRDIDAVEIEGEFYFRPGALTEWVQRRERKAL